MLAIDYVESRKILNPEQEDFRTNRSCSRAITHLGICIEDAHTHNKDIVLCYLAFKGAFPSVDHDQRVGTLTFLGLQEDFINIITNLYNGAITKFVTPHGHTPPIGIKRHPTRRPPLSVANRPRDRTSHTMAQRLAKGIRYYILRPPSG